MTIELALGLALAAAVAGVTVTSEHARHARVLDSKQFLTKMERVAQQTSHECVHCHNEVKMEDIRLLYADESGQIRLVCDRDVCLLAHTQEQGNHFEPIAQ